MVPRVNACTDDRMPLRVRNVPSTVSTNVATMRFTFHALSIPRRSCTMIEWRNAVAVSQGMNDAFSTGSHAQYPPHPNTSYDHHMPAMIAAARNAHDVIVQSRARLIHLSSDSSPDISAPTANANGTEKPT